MRPIIGMLLGIALVGGVLACSDALVQEYDASGPTDSPEVLFATACGGCHSLTLASSAPLCSHDEACQVVTRMNTNGLRLTESEMDAIADYLWDRYQETRQPIADW